MQSNQSININKANQLKQQIKQFQSTYINSKCTIFISQPIDYISRAQYDKNCRLRMFSSIAYNVKQSIQQKISLYANVSIQPLLINNTQKNYAGYYTGQNFYQQTKQQQQQKHLQTYTQLISQFTPNRLYVFCCNSQSTQQQYGEIIMQNEQGTHSIVKVNKNNIKYQSQHKLQQQMKQLKQQRKQKQKQPIIIILYGQNIAIFKQYLINQYLMKSSNKYIIISINLNKNQPKQFKKSQSTQQQYITQVWQYYLQKQITSYYFTQFLIKFYELFIQNKSAQLSQQILPQQSCSMAHKFAFKKTQLQYKLIVPQLEQNYIKLQYETLFNKQRLITKNIYHLNQTIQINPNHINNNDNHQKQGKHQIDYDNNHLLCSQFFSMPQIGLNDPICQLKEKFIRYGFKNDYVIVQEETKVQNILQKSSKQTYLDIYVKSLFLLLTKMIYDVKKVSLKIKKPQKYQKITKYDQQKKNKSQQNNNKKQIQHKVQTFYYNNLQNHNKDSNKNLPIIEIIYQKVEITNQSNIQTNIKRCKEQKSQFKATQDQKVVKIIILNLINKGSIKYRKNRLKLQNQIQVYPSFSSEWIGNVLHFCHSTMNRFKHNQQNIPFDMQNWMKKIKGNPNQQFITKLLKEQLYFPHKCQKITKQAFESLKYEHQNSNIR